MIGSYNDANFGVWWVNRLLTGQNLFRNLQGSDPDKKNS